MNKSFSVFSVIVPTYNQAHYLPACLESLLNQTYSNWEAIVVNDGSTDNTAHIADNYAKKDKRIRVFHKENGGVATALNLGLTKAVGEWICWLSSDDLFESDKLEIHIDSFQLFAETRFFYTHFYYLDDRTGLKSAPDLWNPIPTPPFLVSRFFVGPYIHGNSIAIHRDVFKEVGYFNETLHNGQDYDMWLRISARFPPRFIDHRTCVTRWHTGQSTNEFPEAGFFDSARSAIEFINRTPFPDIFPLLDLNNPQYLLAALQETVDISLNPAAIIHSCGPSTALLDRLAEWIGQRADTEWTVIQDCVNVLVGTLEENSTLAWPIRNALTNIKNSEKFIYVLHDVVQEAASYAQELETMGEKSKAIALQRYIQRFESTEAVRQLEPDRKKLLFYYMGLQSFESTLAGTNSATVGLAHSVAKACPNLTVHLTGDGVTDIKTDGTITILPLPKEDSRESFLVEYETVVFATHIHAFKKLPKPCGQRWLLHQHCWCMDAEAYVRIEEFDLVLALSELHGSNLVKQGVPASKVEVLPNAVDTTRFYPADQPRNNHSIMFAGALVPHKGVHILLQAFIEVRQCLPDAELHIYGSATMWHEEDEYERILRELPLSGVYFHGEIPNQRMPDIYRQHGILCLPSQLESFGLVTIEAQACGCIPVVHDTGGVANTLSDGVTGFLYVPNDPETLARILLKAIRATELDPTMRESAKNYVFERFDSTRQAELLINLLDKHNKIGSTREVIELEIIPPEIKDDDFYYHIKHFVADGSVKTILEIGSSAGEGSTDAFVKGIESNSSDVHLYCMEVSLPRYEALKNRYTSYPFVHCYNVSSVSRSVFPTEKEVSLFYNYIQSNLNFYPLEQVLGWLRQDSDYIATSGVVTNGIQLIKQEQNIDTFDMVLIDGSEFTGKAELNEVYGAKWLLLDDISTYKNYENHLRLLEDPSYELVIENRNLRNGYSIFRRRDLLYKRACNSLPVHFFTIVLNGEPFIRHHIKEFSKLTVQWHWHIIEGVAELNHDTAWSVALGGQITDELHSYGLSNDGTSAYLDELASKNPGRITLYRKPKGQFWDGKLEMVQAPLPNITEECLLWQVDVDEFWTAEQICTAHEMFLRNPDKTAAFYWSWFFVGSDRVVSTRNCYSQNPAQEWLRTWRYTPGMLWAAHEPPCLAYRIDDGTWRDVATIEPFSHAETEANGLIFQHYAYVLEKQLAFKERYYGYKGAVAGWLALQQTLLPTRLKNFFSWVSDDTGVDSIQSLGLTPLMVWHKGDNYVVSPQVIESKSPLIVIDGIFFQKSRGGIARVWLHLLTAWSKSEFAAKILVLDRGGTTPEISGLRYREIPLFDEENIEADRFMLQSVCDEEGAILFCSTYYTVPITTPSVFMAYDMIPENIPYSNLGHPLWQMKHYGIRHAAAFIAISQSTARDLMQFHPPVADSVTVAYCAVDHAQFYPASQTDIVMFRAKYAVNAPYIMFVGDHRVKYKNAGLLFYTLQYMQQKDAVEVICVGGSPTLDPEFAEITPGLKVHILSLDDDELRTAYSGALALTYPSLYEGFGLPILEAMACGCPVITCHNSSIPEVAGAAALYVNEFNTDEMLEALQKVLEPDIRAGLVQMGLRQARRFSWERMAETVKMVFLQQHGTTDA